MKSKSKLITRIMDGVYENRLFESILVMDLTENFRGIILGCLLCIVRAERFPLCLIQPLWLFSAKRSRIKRVTNQS